MKAFNVIKFVFLIVGGGLLAGAFFWYQNTSSFVAQAARAEGTVVELAHSRSDKSTTYAPVVAFTAANGEQIRFKSSVSSNPPSHSVGEKVQVLYAPNKPQDAKIDGWFDLWGGVAIIGGIGFVFFDIAVAIFLIGIFRQRNREHLLQNGLPIDTRFQAVEQNHSLEVNGRHPYRIISQWQDPATLEMHVFESENLWFDPSEHIDNRNIRVFIEPGNPRKYHVDVSFLPKLAA